MKIHTSKSNIKLGAIPSISLPPIETCPNGVLCADKCYALKAWRQYPATRRAWTENLVLYRGNPENYFQPLLRWLIKHKPKFFRFHVSGDIPDSTYWEFLCETAKVAKQTRFLVFTKNFGLDFTMAPSNLSVVLSMWPGHPLPTGWAATLPRAWMQDGTETRSGADIAMPCPGNCQTCGACWGLAQKGLDVVFNLH